MGKGLGYALGGLQLVAGAVLLFVPGAQGAGVTLLSTGFASVVGTALAPTPPRTKELRDSPTYGLDRFDNPRGPETNVAILYGEHRVKPAVIQESVTTVAQGSEWGVDTQVLQRFKWLGVVCEGEVESIDDVEINGRRALNDLQENVAVGKGTGTKKDFVLPHAWVHLGDDENPAVSVFVDGVKKAFVTNSTTVEFVVPAPPKTSPVPPLSLDVVRDDKTQRVLEATIVVYIRGPGYPEQVQLRRVNPYRWTAQRLAPHKVRLRFQARPPTGFTVKVAYQYLAADGLAIVQSASGETRLVFGAAPASGKAVTASYRTSQFRALRIAWRPGTLDQSPIRGFANEENSRTPESPGLLDDDDRVPYDTGAREVDDLRVTIIAPRGFIEFKDDGTGTHSVNVWVLIRYRKLGASNWITLSSGAKGDQWVLQAEKSSSVRWEIGFRDALEALAVAGRTGAVDQLAAFDRGAYEIEIRRRTKAANSPYVQDALEVAHVTEVLDEGLSYPGTCLLAVSAIPGEWLSQQGALRVSCVARRGRLFDPREAGGDRDIGSPFNPALAIRDLVTSSEGKASERFGGGSFFTAADFFGGDDPDTLNGLAAFADWCDEYVHRPGDDATKHASATNGERRCRLSVVLDTPSSLMETVGDLAFLGYAFATLQGATWRFPLDRRGEETGFVFVDEVDPRNQNMSNFVLRLEEWGKTPSAIQGSFWNEFLNYERDELLYPVDGLAEGVPTNVREVDLRGVTRETEAARLLRHLAEQAREMSYPCTWDAHPGMQHIEAGDIVTVKTRVPYSTGGNATELKVRVLALVVSRDDVGKLTVRYSGRVMASQSYYLQPVTVPAAAPPTLRRAESVLARVQRIRNLKARVK